MANAFKASIWVFAISTVVAAPLLAQDSPNPGSNAAAGNSAGAPLTPVEKRFITDSSNTNNLEVQLGQMAMQKAASPDVKNFAQQMVQAHTQAQDQLKKVAAAHNMTLADQLDQQGQKEADKLSKLTGKPFDVAYMAFNIPAHHQTLVEMRRCQPLLKTADLRAWDVATIPVVEAHLKMAQTTDRAIAGEKQGLQAGGPSSY
jgi:putative membrane protein